MNLSQLTIILLKVGCSENDLIYFIRWIFRKIKYEFESWDYNTFY